VWVVFWFWVWGDKGVIRRGSVVTHIRLGVFVGWVVRGGGFFGVFFFFVLWGGG